MHKLNQKVAADVADIKLSMGALTSAVGGFATGLAATVAAGLTFGTVVAVFKRGAEEFRAAEDANLRLQATLKATGSVAGLTAAQIGEIADRFEQTRLVAAESVTDAAGVLLTFKSVSKDVFETALGLAQDLSARFGQDLKGSIVQVGKALEDPVAGISALNRVGVSFTETQQQMIKDAVDFGDKLSAQKIIIAELQSQVGGTGEAEASGLTGAFHRLDAAMGQSLQTLFEYVGGADVLESAIDKVVKAFNFANDAATGKFASPENQLNELSQKYQDLLKQIETAKNDPLASPNNLAAQANIKLLEKEAADIQAQINAIQDQLKKVASDQLSVVGRNAARNADLSVPSAPIPGDKPLDVQAEYEEKRKREEESAKRAKDAKDRAAKAEVESRRRLEEARVNDFNDALDKELEAYKKHKEDLEKLDKERLDDFQKSLDDEIKATKDTIDKKKKAEDDAAKKQAEEMREILLQPWKDLAAAVSRITADMFEEFLTTGKVSLKELATGLNDTFKKSLAGTVGNLVTQPLNQAIADIGSGKYGSVTEFAKANPNLTAAAGGYVFGSALDIARGKETYAGIGGAVGGAAGAAIGTYFLPGVGTVVGGTLGAAAGSALGSLFSAGGGLGNDRSQQVYTSAKRGIAYSDSSYSAGNRNITSTILGQVGQLQEFLGSLGGVFKNFALEVTAGNKSGVTVNGKKYDSNEDALQAALKFLISQTSGLSDNELIAARNSKARSVQDLQKDLGTAKEYDAFIYQGQQVDKQLKDLNAYYTDLTRRSKELGLGTKQLADAYERAAQKIKDADLQMRNSFNRQLSAIFNDSALEQALGGLDDQFDALAAKAKELGYNSEVLAKIEAARAREKEQALVAAEQQANGLQQQIRGQYSNINSFYSGLIDPLQAVNQNAGGEGALAKINKARKEYEDTLALARQGDLEATQQLSGKAQSLEALRQQYLGSSGLGAEIAREVQSGTKEIIESLQSEQKEALASLPEVTRETTKEHIQALVDQTDRMIEELEKLRKEIALQRQAK